MIEKKQPGADLADDHQDLEDISHRTNSRRQLLGAGLGIAAISAALLNPESVFDVASAAPTDIRGSGNVAVKSFSNKNGRYVLYSDGSIVDPTGSRISEDPTNRWPYAPDYVLPKRVRGKSLGSPWVAVDVVQDNNGTHVLFADGSIRTPNDTKVKERNVGELQSYTLFIDGNGQSYHKGMTVNGNVFTFETPFREEPTFFLVDTAGVANSNFYGTGHPGASSRAIVTKESFTLTGRLGNILCTILGVADT